MAVDWHFRSVASLLHCDGTHGGTTFTDESGKTVTTGGAVTLTTATSKFGTASGDFPGGNSDRLSLAAHDDFNFGDGCFTIECWFRQNNINKQYMTLVEKDSGAFPVGSWTLMTNFSSGSAGDIVFHPRDYHASNPVVASTGTDYGDNAWHHVAVTRNGNWWQLWVDGVLKDAETSTATITDLSTAVYYGNSVNANRGWDGELDEIRITKGVARYTTAFTVPAAAGGGIDSGSDAGPQGYQGLPGRTTIGLPGPDGEGTARSLALPQPPNAYDINDQRQARRLIEGAFR